MENPATWKRAENVILAAYNEWLSMNEDGVTGTSMPAWVAAHLRDAGVLKDDDEAPVGASFVKW